ncbi:hypothetical protein OC842_006168 [Tilletia horrida]|uniref:Uncharacterized protein n=1 Tax=Tilletia horrida TaxID=155126 RepID=A0AAN6JHU2_9BASI|nr:hypothetical protein OC842_006168 [Tilletia horrida]
MARSKSSTSSTSTTASVGGTASSVSSGSSTRISAANAKLTKDSKGTKAGQSSPLLTKHRLLNTKLSKQQSSISKAAAFSKSAAKPAAGPDEFEDCDGPEFEMIEEDRGARTSSDEDEESSTDEASSDESEDSEDGETSSDEDRVAVLKSKKRIRSSKKRNAKKRESAKKSKRRKVADDDDDEAGFRLEMRTTMQKLLQVVKVVQHLAHVVEKLSSKIAETDSSLDSTYAKAIIKEPRTGVKLAQRVCWTEKEAREELAAERKAEGIKGEVTATTPIPVSTSTRTCDAEKVSNERLHAIWPIVREICKIFAACEVVRTPDEKGKITTRGIQYYRAHYQSVVDRVVELIEERVEELRYCEDHWKALNFVCRRLKSLNEKDPRRDGVMAELLRVKKEAAPGQTRPPIQGVAHAATAQPVRAKENAGKATKGAASRRRGTATAAATAPASKDADLDDLERRMMAHKAARAPSPRKKGKAAVLFLPFLFRGSTRPRNNASAGGLLDLSVVAAATSAAAATEGPEAAGAAASLPI